MVRTCLNRRKLSSPESIARMLVERLIVRAVFSREPSAIGACLRWGGRQKGAVRRACEAGDAALLRGVLAAGGSLRAPLEPDGDTALHCVLRHRPSVEAPSARHFLKSYRE